MIVHSARTNRLASISGLMAGCAWLSVAGTAVPAWGQCYPPAQATLMAVDAAEFDEFGRAVAVSGDTAVVGANYDDHAGGSNAGSASVFVRTCGEWTHQAKLTANDAADGDDFGISVAVSGDTAVVGAHFDDNEGGSNAGSVYVFVRTDGVWTQRAKLTANDAAPDHKFGNSVAIDGDTVVVGAQQADSAYVFVRCNGLWNQVARLTASDAASRFGNSVSISGNVVLVGADLSDVAANTDAGSAYVFVKPANGWTDNMNMTETAKLIASDASANNYFGQSVSISGDTAVVAATGADERGTDAGLAYVFVKPCGGWSTGPYPMTQTAKLWASNASDGDVFGISVAISGDTVVVGAFLGDHSAGTDAGSAYVFGKPLGGWANMTESARLIASDSMPYGWFGYSVALSGHTAVVGARMDDHQGGIDAGSAYVFDVNRSIPGDIDKDGDVDLTDLTLLLSNFGTTCP